MSASASFEIFVESLKKEPSDQGVTKKKGLLRFAVVYETALWMRGGMLI